MTFLPLNVLVSPWNIEPFSACEPSTTIWIYELPREATSVSSTGPPLLVTAGVGLCVGVGVGSALLLAETDGAGVGEEF